MTTFLHARDNGYKNFWNIDADDSGLYAKPRKIAKIFKTVKDYAAKNNLQILSLDYWITQSAGQNWSFGISYVDNSIDWIGLLKKHCKDDAHIEHYKRLGIPNNADELINYLRKVEEVHVETFYVENLHAIHHSNNIFNEALFGVRHWANGKCYWHVMSEIFGMGKSGSLPIPSCMIKFDIGLTIEESLRCLKNYCESSQISLFEKMNNVVDAEITAILPLKGTNKNLRHCFESLLAQNFKDFKLIITDAGLNNDALKTCQAMENFFGGRMKILTVPKEKLFNAGLQEAKGRYVIFIKGNESFVPDALQMLYAVAANYRADFVHTSNYFVENDDKTSVKTDEQGWGENLKVINIFQQIRDKIAALSRSMLSPSIYDNLIRREFLEEEKISLPFDNEIMRWTFSLQCLCLSEKYIRIAHPVYTRLAEEITPQDFTADIKSISFMKSAVDKIIEEVLYSDEYSTEINFLKETYKIFARYSLKILNDVD